MEQKLINEAHDFIQRANGNITDAINKLPQLINEKAVILEDLERRVNEANLSALDAKKKAEDMNGYKEKSIMWGKINWKSGNTKEIVEGQQDVIKSLATALNMQAEALKLSFQLDSKLANICEFLFYLGSYNIATNEAMIEDLQTTIKDGTVDKRRLSEKAKEQFKNVVQRLKNMQSVLMTQREIEDRSKSQGKQITGILDSLKEQKDLNSTQKDELSEIEKSLKIKGQLDEEQSTQIASIFTDLANKGAIDEEESRNIAELFEQLAVKEKTDQSQTQNIENLRQKLLQKDILDEKQSVQINELFEDLSNKEKTDETQSQDIDSLRQRLILKDTFDKQLELLIEELKQRANQGDIVDEEQDKQLQSLKNKLSDRLNGLDIKCGSLENKDSEHNIIISELKDRIKEDKNALVRSSELFNSFKTKAYILITITGIVALASLILRFV